MSYLVVSCVCLSVCQLVVEDSVFWDNSCGVCYLVGQSVSSQLVVEDSVILG